MTFVFEISAIDTSHLAAWPSPIISESIWAEPEIISELAVNEPVVPDAPVMFTVSNVLVALLFVIL